LRNHSSLKRGSASAEVILLLSSDIIRQADAVECHKTNLVKYIELILVVLMDD
jgi:hypothetical protein